jgi:hypothetical protein
MEIGMQSNETGGFGSGTGAGAALPLVLWVVALLGTSGATALQQVPLWAFALLILSPALLLLAALFLRSLAAAMIAGLRQRRRLDAR